MHPPPPKFKKINKRSATFTATVTYSAANPTAGYYRGFLSNVPWGTSAGTWGNDYNFNLGTSASNLPSYTYLN